MQTLASRTLIALTVCGALGGCRHAGAPLATPPLPDAPAEVRTAWYDDHRIIAVRNEPTQSPVAWAVLGNGQRIEDPRALLPAVGPTSSTALAVQRSEDARTEASWWNGAMVGMMSAGYVTMVVPLLFVDPAAPTSDAELAISLGTVVVGSGLVLASLPLLFQGLDATSRANREAETAFISYDRSVRRQLALPPRAAVIAPGEVLLELPPAPPPPSLPITPSPSSSIDPLSPPEPIGAAAP